MTILTIILTLLAVAVGFYVALIHGRNQYIEGRCDAFQEISTQILERDPRVGMTSEEAAEWPIKAAIHQEVMDRWRQSITAYVDTKVYRQIKEAK